MQTLAFINLGNIGPMEWFMILTIALILFGGRLPEVGRSAGRAIVEFKRGLRDINSDIDAQASQPVAASTDTGRPVNAAPPPLTQPPVTQPPQGAEQRVSRSDTV